MSAAAPEVPPSTSPLAGEWTSDELRQIVFRVWPDLEGHRPATWLNRCLFVAAVLRGEEDIYGPIENRRIREAAAALFPGRPR